MESGLRSTIEELKQEFQTRMASFECDLQKASNSSTGTSGIAAEFASFRLFVTQTLNLLQQQIETLSRSVDTMEMQRRRKILLIHGADEAQNENTARVIADIVVQRQRITDFTVGDIQRCQRLGRPSPQKSRPILVKLQDAVVRDNLWHNKTKLKGSGITLSEFLTKARHDIFLAAREKFGVTKCWTSQGNVFVLNSSGRHRVVSLSDVGRIPVDAAKPAAVMKTSVAPKTRRAVATKK